MNMLNRIGVRSIVAVVVGAVLAAGGLVGCSSNSSDGSSAGGALPADIPVAQGEVIPILSDKEKNNWAFTVVVADAAAQEAAVKALVDAGYTEGGRNDYEGATNVSLSKGTVNVALKLDKDEAGNFRVIYNIVDTVGAGVAPADVVPTGAESVPAEEKSPAAEEESPVAETSPSPKPSKSAKK